MKYTIDLTEKLGEIKPVNGVCNGPSKMTAKYFKKAHIPFARLHDMRTHFHACCDVPSIFRDFDADENDPKNYDFKLSDYSAKQITVTMSAFFLHNILIFRRISAGCCCGNSFIERRKKLYKCSST